MYFNQSTVNKFKIVLTSRQKKNFFLAVALDILSKIVLDEFSEIYMKHV